MSSECRYLGLFPKAQHCFYETIKDKAVDPVHIILDLERDFTAAEAASDESRAGARAATWGKIVGIVEQLLCELCGGGDGDGDTSCDGGAVRLVPGVNCQVLESSYVHKFSRHLLIYASGMVGLGTAAFAGVLHARCLDLDADHADRPLLTYTTAKGHLRSVVDVTIYSMNRPMRMAFCCKRNKPHPMLPILGSSTDVAAHLVNHVSADVFVPPQLLPPLDLGRLPDVKGMAVAARARGPSAASRGFRDAAVDDVGEGELGGNPLEPTARWQPERLNKVRAMLLADEDVCKDLRLQRLVFDDGQEKTLDGGGSTRSFYVKRVNGETYAYCPYAGRVHRSNNVTLVYEHDCSRVYVRCFRCSPSRVADGKPLKVLSIKFPDDAADAMLAGASSGSATLHMCEDLVEYRDGDTYCQRGMKPYPDDPVVVIRANMGIGEFCDTYRDMQTHTHRVLTPHPQAKPRSVSTSSIRCWIPSRMHPSSSSLTA